jgi:magnesium chelatase subunit D
MDAMRQGDGVSSDAAIAVCILAVAGTAVGGISLRCSAGPQREQFVASVRGLMPDGLPVRRLPLNIGDDRLLGGLDLAATLQARRPMFERGLLAEASGGLLIAPMAERMPQSLAARLAVALDSGEVVVERDGFGASAPAETAVLALDEGVAEDERPPQALLDRLAIHLDLTNGDAQSLEPPFTASQVDAARQLLATVRVNDEILRALCGAASELGVASVRAPMLALKVARAHAALCGRADAHEEDTIIAARLVLSPRATQLPAAEREDAGEPEPQQDERQQDADSSPDESEPQDSGALADMVLEAAAAAIPSGLLDRLKSQGAKRMNASTSGRAGIDRSAALRGRAIGARKSDIRSGVRMHLVETLRAAAPWQSLRRQQGDATKGHVAIRREDFRVIRYKSRSETATIFIVDASGSAAMHRLAEAKGAIELLLADCYVRRDQVAMISFRGKAAELILPPTRSLARAKRTLAALPGGGGTPLAAAIDAGLMLADGLRRKGISPTLVFMTDGRANVCRQPTGLRAQAQDDAYGAARFCRAGGLPSLVVDTSPHPGPAAERLATEIGGHYLPLPYADARGISHAIRQMTPDARAASRQ